jgi:IrrE N-terminal-like domain
MRQYRGPGGEERVWFDQPEIEQMMESELRKAALMPTDAGPSVDLEAFIERYLKATLDQYAQIADNVLGVTEFFAGKPPKISINKDLTGSALDEDDSPPGRLGRWRATLAHEAGHVLLHRSLFEFAVGNMDLFGSTSAAESGRQLHRCLKRDATYASGGDWREVQANQAMAALLMPKSFFGRLARVEIGKLFPGCATIPFGGEDRVAARIAPVVEVSRQAARIRLNTLGLVAPQGQRQL